MSTIIPSAPSLITLSSPATELFPSQSTVSHTTEPSPTTPSKQNSKKKDFRGSGFTPFENVSVAKSWISVFENAIVGSEQKGGDFYKTVTDDVYNRTFKPDNRELRTVESIRARCRAINNDCMLFNGSYALVSRLKTTSVSSADLQLLATGLYNGVEMDRCKDDAGKPFRFLLCWGVLRKHEKVFGALAPVSSTSSKKKEEKEQVLEVEEENDVEVDTASRPTGRRKMKELLQKSKETAKKLRLAAESVAAQKGRNSLLKRHFEIMLFLNAPAECDPAESVEYFNTMRAKALADIRMDTNTPVVQWIYVDTWQVWYFGYC